MLSSQEKLVYFSSPQFFLLQPQFSFDDTTTPLEGRKMQCLPLIVLLVALVHLPSDTFGLKCVTCKGRGAKRDVRSLRNGPQARQLSADGENLMLDHLLYAFPCENYKGDGTDHANYTRDCSMEYGDPAPYVWVCASSFKSDSYSTCVDLPRRNAHTRCTKDYCYCMEDRCNGSLSLGPSLGILLFGGIVYLCRQLFSLLNNANVNF